MICPVTRKNFTDSGRTAKQISKGRYLVDAGAERLIKQWRDAEVLRLHSLSGQGGGGERPGDDLLYKAGSPGFQSTPGQQLSAVDKHEFDLMSTLLAPNCVSLSTSEV